MSGLTVIADKPAAAATQGAANFTSQCMYTTHMDIYNFNINAHKHKNVHKHTQPKKHTLIHRDTDTYKDT